MANTVTKAEAGDGTTRYEVSYGTASDGTTQKNVTVNDGTLSALSDALGDDFVPQSEIKDIINDMGSASGNVASDEEQLSFAKEMVTRAVKSESERVKESIIEECGAEFPYTFDEDELASLKEAATALEEANGDEAGYTLELVLPFYNVSINTTCAAILESISRIEEHDESVSTNATTHIANVDAITALDDVIAYDYTSGWAEQVRLNL